MVDPIWPSKFWKMFRTRWDCPYPGFWGRWTEICYQIFKIQNGGSNMAVEISKNVRNSMKLPLPRFLRSLNRNLPSNFQNSKWWIQYGGRNFEKWSELDEIALTQVFEVAESKSAIKFLKSKMVNPIWRSKFWKMFSTLWNCPYTGFWARWVQICHQIFKIKNGGSNMAVEILKIVQNSMKLSLHRFLGSLSLNLPWFVLKS